jgi:hypothetical protein
MSDTVIDGRPVIWRPQRGSQEIFLSMEIPELLFEGTRGPGKTDALLMDFGREVGKGHGSNWKGILFRQTYAQLTDVISKSKKWFPQIWPQAKYNSSEHFWHWPTGEQLLLRHFMKEDDYWNYHGHEYPWIGWEELCNWAMPGGFLRMMSTNRSSHAGVPKRVRATTNPYGPGHNWVKHRYRLPSHRNKLITDAVDTDGRPEPIRGSIFGSIWENKILLDADPEYIQRLRTAAKNEAEVKAWLYGSWDIVAGGMFDDVFDYRWNVVKPFVIPHSWKIDRSFDWGSSAPASVGWWAESDGSDYIDAQGRVRASVRGDLHRIQEWYIWSGKPNEGRRMLAKDIAKGIVERQVRWGIHDRVRAGPADASIFDVENGVSIAKDMEFRVRLDSGRVYPGVRWTKSDKTPGSRRNGWELMRKMLKQAHPPKGGLMREAPGIFIHDCCEHWIRTVPVLPRDEKDMDDVDTDTEDHIADETRYRVRQTGMKVGHAKTLGLF